MQPRSSHHRFVARQLLAAGAAALACHGSAQAGDYDEAVLGDLSGNHLAPSFWQLTDGPLGSKGHRQQRAQRPHRPHGGCR